MIHDASEIVSIRIDTVPSSNDQRNGGKVMSCLAKVSNQGMREVEDGRQDVDGMVDGDGNLVGYGCQII